jgi:c-di-GMP-binding flagellar brake protein YcgR
MQASDDIVTNENRKVQILKGLASARSLLTLALPESKRTMSTTLLDLTENNIILDELVHSGREKPMSVGSRFTAFSKVKGIPVNFRSEVQHIAPHRDGMFYVCSMPDVLKYDQKRSSYRLPVYGVPKPEVTLNYPGMTIVGNIADISDGGAKLLLAPDVEIEVGDELFDCEINLLDTTITSQVKICHVHVDRSRNLLDVGIEFTSLKPRNRHELRDWIFALERKRLRES